MKSNIAVIEPIENRTMTSLLHFRGRRFGRRAGLAFTLIELLVVIAIIAILASLAVAGPGAGEGKGQGHRLQ